MTRISFTLPAKGIVTLKVYNLIGEDVATPIDHALMNGGTSEVTFYATKLASGVYYYRLIFNEGKPDQFQRVMKMSLVK